jgi:hypothetical protein
MRRYVVSRRFVGALVAAVVALFGALFGTVPAANAGQPKKPSPAVKSGCDLGNGVQHVVYLNFDNVHFFRDNPNVPSDLELMPHLLNFLESNGTFLSNNHTPLIAHTTDDILTAYTGLYGDRHGVGISNNYQAYNADGTTDPANAFAYWTDPIFDTAKVPNPGHDSNPNMVYSSSPPASTNPAPPSSTVTPAPWVPFTRAGCDVGNVASANMVLENASVDFPKVFGPNSPENDQLKADPDSFKDAEVADYVGLGVHCAQSSSFCADAQGVKFGQTSASPTASPDVLPDEPGGYANFQALFGHRYVAPQLGAGTPNLSHDGFAVTNAAGNLVDLTGHQINGAFLNNVPGFPGFSAINADQTLAYMADMQESGIPVTYGYISDIHGNEHIPGVTACNGAPSALGSGSACFIAQAQEYDAAFASFFQRLADDGITPANTEFFITADEGDHEAGANVGRAIQPTPANCDGATVNGTTVTPDVLCTYPAGSFGELAGNLTGLLKTQKNNTTPFSLETDTAPNFYVTGNPGPNDPAVRQLERDAAGLTANNPYAGGVQTIANWMADPTEEAILHFVNADPARTPSFTMFAKPDYFLSPGAQTCPAAGCVTQNSQFAWDHGDYAPEINTTWLGLVGPGVKQLGLDGLGPSQGPNSAGPNSGQGTIPGSGTIGTWVDHTDIRPTLMYLTGLTDDYQHDGIVIGDVLTKPTTALTRQGVSDLAACYKQLNSSVGEFGTDTLEADTTAVESSSPNDAVYQQTAATLKTLEAARDALATTIKSDLEAAAFDKDHINPNDVSTETAQCNALLAVAQNLSGS